MPIDCIALATSTAAAASHSVSDGVIHIDYLALVTPAAVAASHSVTKLRVRWQ